MIEDVDGEYAKLVNEQLAEDGALYLTAADIEAMEASVTKLLERVSLADTAERVEALIEVALAAADARMRTLMMVTFAHRYSEWLVTGVYPEFVGLQVARFGLAIQVARVVLDAGTGRKQ